MKRMLSQEALKFLACGLMLFDHIGAVFVPNTGLRLLGRLAFPIFCFLLAEGAAHTRSPARYALRLAIGALLSELPFDLLLCGGFTWMRQSVMLTLLLAFLAILFTERCAAYWKLPVMLLFAFLAQLLRTDYGGLGVCIVLLFHLTREHPHSLSLRVGGLLLLNAFLPSAKIWLIPIQLFAAAAMVPICFYNGRKTTRSSAVQWSFYLFYPLHLTLLWLMTL